MSLLGLRFRSLPFAIKPKRNDIAPVTQSSGSISEKVSTIPKDSDNTPGASMETLFAATKLAEAAIAARCLGCVDCMTVESAGAAHPRP
jgi:hypothetical protein